MEKKDELHAENVRNHLLHLLFFSVMEESGVVEEYIPVVAIPGKGP